MKQLMEKFVYLIGVMFLTIAVCLLGIQIFFGYTLKDIREFEDTQIVQEEKQEESEEKEVRYKKYTEFHDFAKVYGGTRVRLFLPVDEIVENGFITKEGIEDGRYTIQYKEDEEYTVVEGDYVEVVGDIQLIPLWGNVRVLDTEVVSKGEQARQNEIDCDIKEVERIKQQEQDKITQRVEYLETKVEVVPYKSSTENKLENFGKVVAIEGTIESNEGDVYAMVTDEGIYHIVLDKKLTQDKIEIGQKYNILGSIAGAKEGIPRLSVVKLEKSEIENIELQD